MPVGHPGTQIRLDCVASAASLRRACPLRASEQLISSTENPSSFKQRTAIVSNRFDQGHFSILKHTCATAKAVAVFPDPVGPLSMRPLEDAASTVSIITSSPSTSPAPPQSLRPQSQVKTQNMKNLKRMLRLMFCHSRVCADGQTTGRNVLIYLEPRVLAVRFRI